MSLPLVHDREFLAFRNFPFRAPRIADVGANEGQSILSFKALYPAAIIDSFEPNPVHFAALVSIELEFPDSSVRLHRFGLAESPSVTTFFVPTIDGVQYLQEVSMDMTSFDAPWVRERFAERGKTLEFREFNAPVSTGDSQELDLDILKIDVEGAELAVVKGFKRTIDRCRPVIFAENSDYNNVTLHLKNQGYTCWMSDAENPELIRPFEGTRTNAFYVASERLAGWAFASD